MRAIAGVFGALKMDEIEADFNVRQQAKRGETSAHCGSKTGQKRTGIGAKSRRKSGRKKRETTRSTAENQEQETRLERRWKQARTSATKELIADKQVPNDEKLD